MNLRELLSSQEAHWAHCAACRAGQHCAVLEMMRNETNRAIAGITVNA